MKNGLELVTLEKQHRVEEEQLRPSVEDSRRERPGLGAGEGRVNSSELRESQYARGVDRTSDFPTSNATQVLVTDLDVRFGSQSPFLAKMPPIGVVLHELILPNHSISLRYLLPSG